MANKIESTNTSKAISKFTISPLEKPKKGILAVASATFYDTLNVNSITINKSANGNLYVKMPQKRTNQGNYIDVAHPLNAETRKEINDTLINAFTNGNYKQSFDSVTEPAISAQNSFKYEAGEYGNNLARLDVVVNDMVVHNCKIVNGKEDKPFLSMPSYKDKNGEYHSVVTPTNSDKFASIKKAAMSEYNTEYSFKKVNNDELTAIKEAGININPRTNSSGENVIRFKSDDLQKINKAVSSVTSAIKK